MDSKNSYCSIESNGDLSQPIVMPRPPSFPIPRGEVTVTVSIINSTARISRLPAAFLMQPALDHFPTMPVLPSWSFLITHPSGYTMLFDLGLPKDRHQLAPQIAEDERFDEWGFSAEDDVLDVLEENGVDATKVNSVIWSHWHWDHIGDLSRFPPSTDLIVGPGFKENFYPAYPTKSDSSLRDSDFSGRNLIEITFPSPSHKPPETGRVCFVGPFSAYDFFGDGSFYLLDTPGHATGHIAGLARTTIHPDTFIFMGGDLCHHGGQIRPSQYDPLTASTPLSGVIPNATAAVHSVNGLHRTVPEKSDSCRLESYMSFLKAYTGSTSSPLFTPAPVQCVSEAASAETRQKAMMADAQNNIWLVFAHDPSLWSCGTVEFFPKPANQWKARGWRDETRWAFLEDLRAEMEAGNPWVDLNLNDCR